MIKFFKGLKRAADFFSINPDGLSMLTEKRLKDLEIGVSRLPKAVILDKELKPYSTQLTLPVEQVKTNRKPRVLKLKPVEEEVKKVKSKLTQAKVKRLFEYRDGELYWRVKPSLRIKKGDKAGSINTEGYKQVGINKTTYSLGRLVFLMFYGYLPECVSYIDKNFLNTRIENLRAATMSQANCYAKKPKNNTSGYKGVTVCKKKYKAYISKQNKQYHLGVFHTPEEAYKAYCKAAKKLHGEFAQVS